MKNLNKNTEPAKYVALFLLCLFLAACGGPPKGLKVLDHSTIAFPYPGPIRLYVAEEKNRSGADYFDLLDRYELPTFKERFDQGLRFDKLKLDTYTSAGNPVTLKLRNPFEIVADSTEADIVLYLRVDGFEREEVEVTRDRMTVWYGYGIGQTWINYERVPRVLVAIDGQLKEVKTGEVFYGFQARGIAVGGDFARAAYVRAMDRCEIRFYERLLKR